MGHFFPRCMLNIRPVLRKALGIIFLCVSNVLIRSTVFCGVRYFTKNLKNADKLFILAPGSSINEMSKKDFQEISRYDSIGLNYFIFHEFTPTSYLIETHDTSGGYFDYVACNDLKFNRTPILYKGYNSPNKIIEFAKNLSFLRKANLQRFYLMKDAYRSDHRPSEEAEDINNVKKIKDDYFYNDIASLLYVINLGYSCGYTEVVLCGFDFSADYFYCHPKYKDSIAKYPLCDTQNSGVNTIVSNPKTTAKLLNRVQELAVFFKDRQGGIYQFKCKGRLDQVLKKYTFNQ